MKLSRISKDHINIFKYLDFDINQVLCDINNIFFFFLWEYHPFFINCLLYDLFENIDVFLTRE